jgi:phage terminase small subunit
MGKRGPAKDPTARLEAKGSWRAKVRKDEPVYGELTETRMPSGLKYHGKKIWQRLLPLLEGQGVLTDADIAGLERYCFLWQTWKDLTKEKELDINKIMKIESGFSKLEQQFGLTPASRPNIKATKIESKEDKSQRFFPKVG